MRRPGDKEMFYVAHLMILSAMVRTIESVGLSISIQSPQNATTRQNLTFSQPLPIYGVPNLTYIEFVPDCYANILSGEVNVGVSETTTCWGSYGDVARSDFSVIDQHLAEYGVSSFVTTYAFMIKWTHVGLTLVSKTLWSTNGNQTYYSHWVPVGDNATLAGLYFDVDSDLIEIAYLPPMDRISVFQVDSANVTQLFMTSTTTTMPNTAKPRNSAKIFSANNSMLLTALLLTIIAYTL